MTCHRMPARRQSRHERRLLSPKPGWRDRVWSLPAVVAVALVSVILGGLGGAALANASDDADDGRFGSGTQPDPSATDTSARRAMMNDRQRERWREWRQEQRREMGQPGRPSPMRPTPSR